MTSNPAIASLLQSLRPVGRVAELGSLGDKLGMSEERGPKSSHGGFMWIALAVPLVYVLSIGPVAALAERSGSGGTAIRQIYAPIIWLHNNTFLEKPLEAYLGLWGVE